MRILYVEDEQNDLNLVSRFLQGSRHQLVTAPSLSDARKAMHQQPELVLVDVLLDQSRDGFAFVQELRKTGFAGPIIAVTGLSLPTDTEMCFQVGCNEVLHKPYDINELASLIERYAA